ncbi:hypothetical protein C8R45DRAFT_554437 [Mycena sanguinolenta]|nr:hypothetical protein C8R45DRAFT_554437 [Mycena sanguinolenta]
MSASPAVDERRARDTGNGGNANANSNTNNSGTGNTNAGGGGRAASQPPHSHATPSPKPSPYLSPTSTHPTSPWSQHSHSSHPHTILGAGHGHRSASFSAGPRFPSTFEDDELLDPEEAEMYDAPHTQTRYHSPTSPHPPSSLAGYRGRTTAGPPDLSRSRSQSLATTGAGMAIGTGRAALGSGYGGIGSAANSYSNAYLYGNNAYGHPYGGGNSLSGSLTGLSSSLSGGGGLSSSLSGRYTNSPLVRSGSVSSGPAEDGTNMSPFVRDVGSILLDDGSFRELWERERGARDYALLRSSHLCASHSRTCYFAVSSTRSNFNSNGRRCGAVAFPLTRTHILTF